MIIEDKAVQLTIQNDQILNLVTRKNAWLSSQVDVEFPTKESIAGRELYRTSQSNKNYSEEKASDFEAVADELYIVDFHRLTICFAMLSAKHWESESDQALMIEFLTQIILEPNFPIIIAFKNGEPVGCALSTLHNNEILISDIYLEDFTSEKYINLVQQLINFISNNFDAEKYYVEHHNFHTQG